MEGSSCCSFPDNMSHIHAVLHVVNVVVVTLQDSANAQERLVFSWTLYVVDRHFNQGHATYSAAEGKPGKCTHLLLIASIETTSC